MRDEYKRELDELGPRQEELDRLYAMLEGGTSMKRNKKLGGRAMAAIAVCAALAVTAAAAAVPAVWETLADQLGIFAPYARTIEGAVCSDQGIEIQVLSALSDDLQTRVYLSVRDMTGDRLNQFLKLTGELATGEALERDEKSPGAILGTWGFPSTDHFQLVSYDPETKTALLSANISYADTAQPTHEATLSVTGMSTREAALYAAGIPCAAVTGRTLDSLPGDPDQVVFWPDYLEGGGFDNSVLPAEHVVLAPGQTPMDIEGTEDMRISSMGFASDGCFHIRLEFADGVEPAFHEHFVFDPESGATRSTGETGSLLYSDLVGEDSLFIDWGHTIRETLVEGGMDITFPLITPDHLETLRSGEARVYGTYDRPGTDLEGDWSTTFELDYYPSVTLDWTGEIAGWQVRQVTVSPLSVAMYSNNSGEFHTTLYALKKDGSTVAAEPGTGRYTNLDAVAALGGPTEGEGYDAFNTWKFEEPVDVEDIVSLTLGDATIPMNGTGT